MYIKAELDEGMRWFVQMMMRGWKDVSDQLTDQDGLGPVLKMKDK